MIHVQSPPSDADQSAKSRTAIVLVHGLASSGLLLSSIGGSLSRSGYGRIINWGYPSITRTIAHHGDRLRNELERLSESASLDRIRLITHSMGGILARHALAERPQIGKLDRVIMMCPPNGGSRVATNLSKVLGVFCTPLSQLSHRPDSFVNTLPAHLPYEVGVIAAKRDRVVAVERTDLPGSADHVVLPAGHTSILFTRRLHRCVRQFLDEGRFAEQTDSATR